MMRHDTTVDVNVPELEQRLLDLQWRVERLSYAAEQNVQSVEQRMAGLADHQAEHLKRWAVAADRHARTIAQLECRVREWREANDRVQQDTFERLRELETIIRQECDTIRTLHEQPVKELREQASSPADASAAAADGAWNGFDRVEARLAAFENDVRLILGEFGRELQAAVRILSDRQPGGDPSGVWRWRFAALVLGLMVIAAGGFGWHLQNEVRAVAGRAQQAELELQKTVAAAAQQVTAAREEAAREIASAREMATRAELIGSVLAAPDLIRWNLAGSGGTALSGQALWSRTRGFVFSGSRIPVPPPNGTYQVWLLTRSSPVRAATFTPAPDGTVTLAVRGLSVPRAVVGAMVTIEGLTEPDVPSADPVLTSVRPPPVLE